MTRKCAEALARKKWAEPGTRLGQLTVLGKVFYIPTTSKCREAHFVCQCDCGGVGVYLARVATRRPQSCRKCSFVKTGNSQRVHDKSDEKLYNVWQSMKDRCFREKCKNYKDYGGRGITVCEEWRSDAAAFLRWSHENGYAEGLQIDRIDNDGNYEPTNCRWAVRKTQARNKRNNLILTAFGESKPLAEWAEDGRCAVCRAALHSRVFALGWEHERAISTPAIEPKYRNGLWEKARANDQS